MAPVKNPRGSFYQNFLESVNKSDLRAAILARLQAELAQQTAAAHLARDEAISEESRPENKYDTHSQEAAYLAEGQARLAREISENIAHYAAMPLPAFGPQDEIALGALVELSSGRGNALCFIGPRAGGLEVAVGGAEAMVITPQSPLGRALLGRRAGEVVQLPGRASQRILSVA